MTVPAMSRRWDLLAHGDPCADVVVALEEASRFGEKVVGRPLGIHAGGTTANAACAFSRLGGRAAVYGRVGDDAHAALLRQSLQDFGVDMTHLRTEPHSACACVICWSTQVSNDIPDGLRWVMQSSLHPSQGPS